MIELTEAQARALESPEATPPRLVNPRTKETFVLLRVDEYQRLTEDANDGGSSVPVSPHGLRRFGTLKGSVLSIAPDFDDVPPGFEDYLP